MSAARLSSPLCATAALIRGILLAALPSFLADHFTHDRQRRSSKQHATSYLDGLRGLAACAVFAYHYTDYNHKHFLPHYGYGTDGKGSSILQLPYIRLLYSGTPMVHIFFVISGFSLAFRPLRMLHSTTCSSNSPDPSAIAKCHTSLASSAFRRPLRIFGPPMVATSITAAIQQHMKPQETKWKQFNMWSEDFFRNIANPWTWEEGSLKSRYNPHLWTIPVEFVHSMFLFLIILMASRQRTPLARQALLVFVMIFVLVSDRWACFEFVAGAFLADIYLHGQLCMPAESKNEDLITPIQSFCMNPTYSHSNLHKIISSLFPVCRKMLNIFVLLAAGYILSWPPREADMTPSYLWIQSLIPQGVVGTELESVRDIWLALAAVSAVWVSGRLTLVKRVLNSGFAQYAGKISFSFYLLQHTVLNLIQHHTLGAEANADEEAWGVRGMTGIQTPFQRTVAWLIGLFIIGSALVWAADLFTRLVDGPIVKFAKWLEKNSFAEDTGE